MNKEIDLSKFQIRTDLAIDYVNQDSELFGVKHNTEIIDNLTITNVELDSKNALNKKKGKYITIEFDDVTDIDNNNKVTKVLTKVLKEILNINNNSFGLIVGLGNDKSTPDSLGPLVIKDIIVTNHLYILNEMSDNYKRTSAINPGVMGETGIETSDIIESIVKKIKPDYIIAIDSLASNSIERLNKTIQITNTGIHPGSGVGNKRKELSFETLGIPVIAIGVPTVVDATVIVTDTINFIYKNYAFNKEYMNNPKSKLTFNNINYLKKEIKENKNDKKELLGLVGTLDEKELQTLIFEVLNPIGYNLMVTPKEIDFVIKKLSNVISNSINNSIHDIDKKI